MPSLTDEKFAALRTQEFTGGVNEMTAQWLTNFGASKGGAIPDMWEQMLAAQLPVVDLTPTGQRNTDWFALLRGLGHTGAMNDMELQFWEAGGVFPP